MPCKEKSRPPRYVYIPYFGTTKRYPQTLATTTNAMTTTEKPFVVSFLSILLSLSILFSESAETVGTGSFLWFSDLHLDPYYGQSGAVEDSSVIAPNSTVTCSSSDAPLRGMWGCDSPLTLVQSAVAEAADLAPNPDFVLITGDFARHAVEKTPEPMATLVDVHGGALGALNDALSEGTPVILCLGNNDLISDYYLDLSAPDNPVLAATADSYGAIGTFESDEEESTFRSGGYYGRDVAGKVTILALNTVIYSQRHEPAEQNLLEDPAGQFAWMEIRLSEARSNGRTVIISGHIPPTIGSYRKAQYWNRRHLDPYFALLDRYEDVVVAQLFGHLHTDEFRVFPSQGDGGAPLLIAPSVSPIFGGNPCFRVVRHDRGSILDYSARYLDLGASSAISASAWRELYSFQKAYGVDSVSVLNLRKLLANIDNPDDPTTFEQFLFYYRTGVETMECEEECRRDWVCVLQSQTEQAYKKCLRWGWSDSLYIVVAASGALISVVSVALCCFYLRHKRRRQYEEVESRKASEYNIEPTTDIS